MSGIAIKAIPLSDLTGARSFLQTKFWALTKADFGWIPRPFSISYEAEDFSSTISVLALERKIAPAVSFAYIPQGPELPPRLQREDILATVGRSAKPLFSRTCAFVRFDLPWIVHNIDARFPLSGSNLRKAPVDVQPPDTVIVDLVGTEEDVLARMKSKTRYNTRLAAKKGVETECLSIEALDRWYDLYRDTAERDRIQIHSIDYYRSVLSHALEDSAVEIRIIMATFKGNDLAGIIVVFHGDRATYLYGASSSKMRNLMASYAAQWRGITLARQYGCKSYDLFGISPTNDPNHPMHGLYRVKTGYSSNIVHVAGCFDYRYRVTPYSLYSIAEAARLRWRNRAKKR